ncbi:MAG TPA: conjugative transposon protein TraK [Mucilaginibacter sp.]|nr:conjugative transposon protein TraK [Mucilaginibacter sp.]
MKNIDTAFNHIRGFSLVFLTGCVVLGSVAIIKSFQMVMHMQQHIYILANGKALEAFSAERKDNIPVEARDHIRMFHYFFFTLDPDEKVIQANITKALYMADNSAENIYRDLKEQGYYSDMISGNISQQIIVDSIKVDMNQYPYAFYCYAREKMIRSTSIVTRSLITEGFLRNVSRSDNNPHGFLIERWNILTNNDIKTENR